MRTRRPHIAVITEADESPQEQLRRRQRRYGTLMLLRVLCLILAAVLVSLHVPFTLFWVLLLTLGMVAFPWMAVLIANDRPPKEASRFTTRLRRRGAAGSGERELAAQPGPPPGSRDELPAASRIIDADG